MPHLPNTVAFTRFEGAEWERFYPRGEEADDPREQPYTVHSILFEDGSIWDSVNGWRPQKDLFTAKVLIEKWSEA